METLPKATAAVGQALSNRTAHHLSLSPQLLEPNPTALPSVSQISCRHLKANSMGNIFLYRSRNCHVEDWEDQLVCLAQYFLQMWCKPLSCTHKKRWRRKPVISPVHIPNAKKPVNFWRFVQCSANFKRCKSLKIFKTSPTISHKKIIFICLV